MQQLPLSFTELITIVAYFCPLVFLLASGLQLLFLYLKDQKIGIRQLLILLLTQSLAFALTIIIWLKWPMGLKILIGPILFPALLAEFILVPLINSFFGYRIAFSKQRANR
jgi:hypothetical protein